MSFYYSTSPDSSSYYNGMGSGPSSTGSSDGNSAVAAAAAQNRVTSFSRPSSVSPQMSQVYPVYMSSRARFNASRGFEAEDDLEFCPALVVDRTPGTGSAGFDSDKSPQSPSISPQNPHAYLPSSATGSPQQSGPARVKRAIQIVNPNTGLRVSSPTQGKR